MESTSPGTAKWFAVRSETICLSSLTLTVYCWCLTRHPFWSLTPGFWEFASIRCMLRPLVPGCLSGHLYQGCSPPPYFYSVTSLFYIGKVDTILLSEKSKHLDSNKQHSVVKSACCSCRWPGFSSWHLHWATCRYLLIPAPGNPVPSSVLWTPGHIWLTDTDKHIIFFILKKFK